MSTHEGIGRRQEDRLNNDHLVEIKTLREYVDLRIESNQVVSEAKWKASQDAISKADAEIHSSIKQESAIALERLTSIEKLLNTKFDAAQLAVGKAEKSNEDRFAGQTRYREQLRDDIVLVNTLVSTAKNQLDARLSTIEGKLVAYSGATAFFVSLIAIALHFIPQK